MNKLKTLKVRTTAQRLGHTLNYIYGLIYSGRLPAEKVGREWRIPTRAVENRLKEREDGRSHENQLG